MKVNLNKPGLRESVIFSEFIFSAFDPKEKVPQSVANSPVWLVLFRHTKVLEDKASFCIKMTENL